MAPRKFFKMMLLFNLIVLAAGLVNEFYTFCPSIFGVPMVRREWIKLQLSDRFTIGFIITVGWMAVNEVIVFFGWLFMNRRSLLYRQWRWSAGLY